MAGYLHAILSSVGVGATIDGCDYLIEHCFTIVNRTEMQGITRRIREGGTEDFRDLGNRSRTAYPDEGKRATGSGSRSADCIVKNRSHPRKKDGFNYDSKCNLEIDFELLTL